MNAEGEDMSATVGELAPEFSLPGTIGPGLDLAELRGKGRAALFFYPADRTAGWTNQLAAVRGAVDAFRAIDTEPYGVNQADAASHLAFIEEQELPFDLLVDEGLYVARAYDALKPDGKSISRTVVVVGKDGRIIYRASGAPPPEEIIAAIGEAGDE
jgi:thioredoxin-dependent peroxiredoxin